MGRPKVAEQHTHNFLDDNGVLLAAATLNSGPEFSRGYAEVFGHCQADQAGTVFVEQSRDAINWDISDSSPVAANTTVRWNIAIKARYCRARYLNGAVNQGAFRIYCSFIRIRSPNPSGFVVGPVGPIPGLTPFQIIRSDKDLNFTTGLVTNAQEQENLTGLLKNTIIIRQVNVQSDQNLEWDLLLFQTDLFNTADLDTDRFVARIRLPASLGVQIAGAGQFYYDLQGIDIRYQDLDATNELHVTLVNRSAAAKTAGAAGEFVAEFHYDIV